MFVRTMNLRRQVVCTCAVASLWLGSATLLHAQQPDNSGTNKGQQTTAESQSTNTSDRHITAQIRRSVVGDKSLSTYGHNVKIITKGGAVTLKGPVHSEEEKKDIKQKAEAVAGQGKVTNELTVKQ